MRHLTFPLLLVLAACSQSSYVSLPPGPADAAASDSTIGDSSMADGESEGGTDGGMDAPHDGATDSGKDGGTDTGTTGDSGADVENDSGSVSDGSDDGG